MPTSVELCDELGHRLRSLADARRTTPRGMLEEAVEPYVDREEKRDAFRRDAVEAWNDDRRTGLHVAGAEAEAWLSKLEAGEDAEPPECHI